MNFPTLLKFFASISPWFIVKIFILILLFLYICLAGIVTRQVDLMNQVLEAKFSPVIKIISLINLLVTVLIFIVAFFTL